MTEEQKFKLRDLCEWYGVSREASAYKYTKANKEKSDVFLENVINYVEKIVEDRVDEALAGY